MFISILGGGVHQIEPKCHIDMRFQLFHSWGGVHQPEPKCHIDLRFQLSHSCGGGGGYIRSHSYLLQVSNPEMKCSILDYVQLLRIGWAGQWTRTPSVTLSSQKNEMLLFGLCSTSDDWPGRSSEVECNPKISISFFWLERGGRWGSSPSTSLADHQKLNIIQKQAFHFCWPGEGWRMGFESIYPYPFEIEIHQFPVQA